ncbi:MAG: UDP-glucose 4-epimerase [Thermoleophilaceae bacterium]|nr:UDP-glucose 4-epimerase [Thermoleophilaceae bacterium]MEA2351917.1 UDP-glucose 4-epimerase [Thermoleophilaceae bacterium]
MPGRRILITGIASYLGTELARILEDDPEVEYVAGLDTRRPRAPLERTELIELDIRDPGLLDRVPATRVDTVVHNQIVRRSGPGMSSRRAHDVNVIGSLQLLAACERIPTLEAIVVRGSAGIYGAEPAAPQFFTEDMARLYPLRTRFQRDVAEIENLFGTFCRRHESVVCTMLRYQPSIGPAGSTQIPQYLSLPVVPTYLGFDPRIQLIHERDALDALVAAVRRPVRGPVNVAAEGTIGLTRMIRLAGRPTIPIPSPLFGSATSAAKRVGMFDFSADLQRLLRYGRGVDTSRLSEELGCRPRFTTGAAVEDWVAAREAAGAAAA